MPVKSFQGERAQKKRVTPSKLTVSDIMQTQLILFRPEQIIHQVMQTFIKHRISGGPVVDERGTLIGIISEADCMKEISDSRYFNMPILDKSVQHFMTKNVDTISETKTTFDAIAMMKSKGYRHLPVVSNSNVVGILSMRDLYAVANNQLQDSLKQHQEFLYGTGYGG